MLKVFQPNDTVFTSNGDAVIQATRAVVHKVDNGDYYLEIETGLDYLDFIKPRNIIVTNTPQGAQAFRISTVDTTRKKIKAKCYHVYYDSNNYIIADSYVVNANCNAALQHLNAATDNLSPFTTLSDVLTINSFRCVRKSLNEAINTVLERWGGHLVRDNFEIQIKNVIGNDNGVVIQYKKNLKDITVKYNWGSVCTKVLPVGADGLLLDEKYIYSNIQYSTPFSKVVSFDQAHINRDDYETEAAYKAALLEDLKTQAINYVNAACLPQVNYTVNANVEKITDVGDIGVVYDERLGVQIDAAVLSFDYDCILDKYIKIEFGSLGYSLSNLISSVKSEITTAIQENNTDLTITLQAALAVAEERIWQALGSSYCIYSGDQILIVDSLPAETARNCIRINSGGIAFSQNGINGEFITAWTIDGTFNAQAINVINFTADLIKGGTLKLGSNMDSFGRLEVYDPTNALIAKLDNDGLILYGQNGNYLVMNTEVGFAGYDRLGNKIFWVAENEFHMQKAVIENEITLCNKMRFIPVTVTDENETVINDGIGLVAVLED